MKLIINNQIFNLEIASNFWKRFKGLMGKNNIKTGMFFPKTNSIHTFFMKEKIDIIMINKDNVVVFVEKNFKKNRIIIKKEAYHTIELPANSIKNIKVGDKLMIN